MVKLVLAMRLSFSIVFVVIRSFSSLPATVNLPSSPQIFSFLCLCIFGEVGFLFASCANDVNAWALNGRHVHFPHFFFVFRVALFETLQLDKCWVNRVHTNNDSHELVCLNQQIMRWNGNGEREIGEKKTGTEPDKEKREWEKNQRNLTVHLIAFGIWLMMIEMMSKFASSVKQI